MTHTRRYQRILTCWATTSHSGLTDAVTQDTIDCLGNEFKPDGRALVERELDRGSLEGVIEAIYRIKGRYNDELSFPEVIDEVYTESPTYAEDSVY